MIKDITIGQFFPGSSVIHRVDPRVKLVLTFTFIVVLFIVKGWLAYTLCFGLLVGAVVLSKISYKMMLKGLKPILFIIIFTSVLNIFYIDGEPVFKIWIFTATKEGFITAFFMAFRIIMLIASTSLMTYTTSPIALTDALESLMKPLRIVKFPVHEFAMMMTIALRFIPTLIEETDKIMSAQKARGADFESGNLIARAKALVPILVPLFVSAFRRADELATAMECRLYQGGENRTRLKVLKMTALDYQSIAVCIVLFGGILAISITGIGL